MTPECTCYAKKASWLVLEFSDLRLLAGGLLHLCDNLDMSTTSQITFVSFLSPGFYAIYHYGPLSDAPRTNSSRRLGAVFQTGG